MNYKCIVFVKSISENPPIYHCLADDMHMTDEICCKDTSDFQSVLEKKTTFTETST